MDILNYCNTHTVKELFDDVNKVGKIKYLYNNYFEDGTTITDMVPVIINYNLQDLSIMRATVYKVDRHIDDNGSKSVTVYIEEFGDNPEITLNSLTDEGYNKDYVNNCNLIVLHNDEYNLCSFKESDDYDEFKRHFMDIIIDTLNINTLDELVILVKESIENMMIHYHNES